MPRFEFPGRRGPVYLPVSAYLWPHSVQQPDILGLVGAAGCCRTWVSSAASGAPATWWFANTFCTTSSRDSTPPLYFILYFLPRYTTLFYSFFTFLYFSHFFFLTHPFFRLYPPFQFIIPFVLYVKFFPCVYSYFPYTSPTPNFCCFVSHYMRC